MIDDFAHCPPSLGVIILCAGSSSRLGSAKQHVQIGHQTLLERSVKLALEFNQQHDLSTPPLVVSGPHSTADAESFRALPVDQAINEDWQNGMASSIALGISYRQQCSGVLIVLVDQYRVTLSTLNSLYERWIINLKLPVAANFSNTLGPPVIWPSIYFAKLRQQQSSPKTLLLNCSPQSVRCDEAVYDVDTLADLDCMREYFDSLL